MIEQSRAQELAEAAFEFDEVVLGAARELDQGWFFPCIAKRSRLFAGVIVNKETGRHLLVMTESSLARDLTLYDVGYQFERYDVVVLTIEDLDEAVRTLLGLGDVTVDTYYRYGRVYRVGRRLTEAEVRERLSTLPAVFSNRLAFNLESLEHAREQGWFEFKALEYRGKE
jgi:hypothetical protein